MYAIKGNMLKNRTLKMSRLTYDWLFAVITLYLILPYIYIYKLFQAY